MKKIKPKAFTMTTSVFITALTTAVGVYAGIHIDAGAPGSILAQAVPVGISTAQQVVLMAWTEFSEHLNKTCTA